MSKAFFSKRKAVSSLVAVGMTALIVFGGTFAWQSISQEALNEVSATRNPGGRLHDDFNDITASFEDPLTFDKNVFVENFTTLAENGSQIFARVRLDEYMEFGDGAGMLNEEETDKHPNNQAVSLVYGAELANKETWTTRLPGDGSPFQEYWVWDMEQDDPVAYMPTFNKDRDSLEADINGTFDADFADYVDYSLEANKSITGEAIYDNDDDENDDQTLKGYDQALTDGNIAVVEELHDARETGMAEVLTMQEWIDQGSPIGDFWVWDTDGWAYWAAPITPYTATGLLLDGINRTTNVIDDDWYYGINVVGQFITKDDLGRLTGRGFYDQTTTPPSPEALELLKVIGVEVEIEAESAEGLTTALNFGGKTVLSADVNAEAPASAAEDTNVPAEWADFPMDFYWDKGGILTSQDSENPATIVMDNDGAFAGLVVINMTEETTAAPAVIKDIKIEGNANTGIYAQSIDAPLTLTNVEIINGLGLGFQAEYGGGLITLNGCTISAADGSSAAAEWKQTAVAAGAGADIVVNGGEYSGLYAAYVLSSGGSITINGGVFDGKIMANKDNASYPEGEYEDSIITINGGTFEDELLENGGTIVVKGGLFKHDPTAFLAPGYTATHDADLGYYVVK